MMFLFESRITFLLISFQILFFNGATTVGGAPESGCPVPDQEPCVGCSCRTVSGSLCRSGMPCGRHGQEHYWCYTSVNNERWDYCCNPDSECNNKHTNYLWCWVNERSDVYRECIRNDIQSRETVNGGVSCRGDHPCGKHGYSYYWCYTDLTGDDDSWDFCCQDDSDCNLHGQDYDWCRIGTYNDSSWRKCVQPLKEMKRDNKWRDSMTRFYNQGDKKMQTAVDPIAKMAKASVPPLD